MRSMLRALFDMYDTPGKIALALGLVGLAASAVMAFFFGKEISWTHGVFLVVVAICAAVGPHLAHNVWHVSKVAGAVVAVCCIPLLAIEFYTHMGYTAGLRGVNIGEARVQNMTFGDNRDSVAQALQRVEDLKTVASTLASDLNKLTEKKIGDWKVSVRPASSTALDGAIAAKKLEVANEAKRGGCKARCEARTNELAHLEELKAAAKAIEDNNAAAVTAAADLEKAKKEAGATEFKHSAAGYQASAIVKLVAMVYSGTLKASDMQSEAVEQSVNTGMAVAATGLPALFLFIASFFYMRRQRSAFPQGRPEASEPAPTLSPEPAYASPSITMPVARTAAAPQHHRNMVVKATTNTIADLRRTLQGIGSQPAYGTM